MTSKRTKSRQGIVFPHFKHEGGAHFTNTIEDNMKLMAELKACAFSENLFGSNFWKKHLPEDGELEGMASLRRELWEAYQSLIAWICVADGLSISIDNPEEVQRVLDILWHNIAINPFIRNNANPSKDDTDKYKLNFKML